MNDLPTKKKCGGRRKGERHRRSQGVYHEHENYRLIKLTLGKRTKVESHKKEEELSVPEGGL